MSLRLQPWPSLSTTAHLTYLQTDIKETTAKLRNRPKWRGGFAVQWAPRPDLDVHLHTIVVGTVPDSSIPTGARTLDPYARVDLAVNWTLTRHWQVFVAVEQNVVEPYERRGLGEHFLAHVLASKPLLERIEAGRRAAVNSGALV